MEAKGKELVIKFKELDHGIESIKTGKIKMSSVFELSDRHEAAASVGTFPFLLDPAYDFFGKKVTEEVEELIKEGYLKENSRDLARSSKIFSSQNGDKLYKFYNEITSSESPDDLLKYLKDDKNRRKKRRVYKDICAHWLLSQLEIFCASKSSVFKGSDAFSMFDTYANGCKGLALVYCYEAQKDELLKHECKDIDYIEDKKQISKPIDVTNLKQYEESLMASCHLSAKSISYKREQEKRFFCSSKAEGREVEKKVIVRESKTLGLTLVEKKVIVRESKTLGLTLVAVLYVDLSEEEEQEVKELCKVKNIDVKRIHLSSLHYHCTFDKGTPEDSVSTYLEKKLESLKETEPA